MDCSTKSEQRQITAIVTIGDAEEKHKQPFSFFSRF